MLNKDNIRELAYIVQIDAIEPIVGSDNCEAAVVGGWRIMVRKQMFEAGDLAIYFEIDSKLDDTNPAFAFLKSKHYKVKTQKYTFGGKGNFISQGLLMAAEDLGWTQYVDGDGTQYIHNNEKNISMPVGTFLTEELKVTYAVTEDNARKANSADKYKKMAQRHPKLFKNKFIRWIYRKNWGKKLLFVFFGRKKDRKTGWPSHIASKTDVERIQNMIYVLKDKKPYVATEKIDGSSMSVMAERGKFGKVNQYICSRNVVFENPSDKCFYDTNIYFEAYEKYNLGEKIVQIMNDLNLPNIALQMEVFGPSVQKRDYSLKEREIRVFHIVSNGVKFPMDRVVEICAEYDIPHVPILDYDYILPDTLEELQTYVEGTSSVIDDGMKEGIVFYDKETGQQYFKFVSPEFLLKYHN